jgi:prepilin-type N-terminal cleavage/methylation domain-containing protein
VANRSGARGYTAIEVLLAMTVAAIGAAAVMSMQKATMQGDLDARKMDVANSIARTWVERLERDAMQWTLPGPALANAPSNMSNALLFANNVGAVWYVPTAYAGFTPPQSYGFDILGRDLAAGDVPSFAIFCVNVRVSTLVPNQLLRADVRVLWLGGLGTSGANPAPFCSPQNTDMTSADPNSNSMTNYGAPAYRAIYVSTAIRENP